MGATHFIERRFSWPSVSAQHLQNANVSILILVCGKENRVNLKGYRSHRFQKGMTMKGMIALALVVGAVALGACRREEAVVEPMKLGATPAAEQSAR
jgi:hypothetical protein